MPKLVRKTQTSWRSLVLDQMLELSENISLLDWDKLSARWALPVGLAINSIHWSACIQASYLQKTLDDNIFVSRKGGSREAGRSASHWWLHAMRLSCLFFITMSIINALYCFTRQKEYQIRHKRTNPPGDSAFNISPTTTETSTKRNDVSKTVFDRISSHFGHPYHSTSIEGMNSLMAWNPSKMSLRLFAVFSPLHAILTWMMPRNAMTFIFLLLLSCETFYLIVFFERHVEDKKIIYGQVFSEYESSFVQPRIGVMKRDVGVGTRPDDNGVYVEVHTPKVGIIDAAKTATDIPRSASQVRMHDWERPIVAKPFPASPNVWAAQSPFKNAQSVRRNIPSPAKLDGSPTKMYRPAAWVSGSHSSNPFVQHPSEHGTIKKSKTMSFLSQPWE